MRALVASTLVLLAGCSIYDQPSTAQGKVVSGAKFIPGSGVIDSVGVVSRDTRRLYLRMDVGGFQTVDTDNPTFMAGEFVELTPDGRVVHVSGTTLNK